MQSDKKNWITNSLTESLIKFSKKNKNIVVLDADLSDDLNLKKFAKIFPNRFIQNGIAEQDMVSMAGGIALQGMLPVVNSFASFLTARANEQIYNNATENTKIIYLNLYAGLLPAGAGKSHQSLRDISLLNSIPNFRIFHPLNYIEVDQVLNHCIFKEKKNCAIRLSIGPPTKRILKLKTKIDFKPGIGQEINKGKKVVIFSYGQYVLNEVLKTVEILKIKKIFPTVINMSSINFFSTKWLKKIVSKHDYIFTIDDHSISGGLGDNILNELHRQKIIKNKNFFKIGIESFPECGTIEEVLKYHKLDSKSLYKTLVTKIKKK